MADPLLNAFIATNRFGLGAGPGEAGRISSEPLNWLLAQMKPIVFAEKTISDSQEFLALAAEYRQNPHKDFSRVARQNFRRLASDTVQRAIGAGDSFNWRMFDFFSNHFSVTARPPRMTNLAATLEREAIGPNLWGKFEELLIAVSQHPAMLMYLNNERSTGPNSRNGQKREKGLNENLAREILELHTLGVTGGYTQADVIELAKGISGWSYRQEVRAEANGFVFRRSNHEPGTRKLLGQSYTARGRTQGEHMLRDLARHPSTARHISYKIARHLVADKPPPALVDAMTTTWLKTGGNIPAVVTRLLQDPLSWQPEQKKFKTPREYLLSVYRGLDINNREPHVLLDDLGELGQSVLDARSPAGYSDSAADWASSDGLRSRIEWVASLAQTLDVDINAKALAENMLGPHFGASSKKLVYGAETPQLALNLLLMSPEFMRR